MVECLINENNTSDKWVAYLIVYVYGIGRIYVFMFYSSMNYNKYQNNFLLISWTTICCRVTEKKTVNFLEWIITTVYTHRLVTDTHPLKTNNAMCRIQKGGFDVVAKYHDWNELKLLFLYFICLLIFTWYYIIIFSINILTIRQFYICRQ